MSRFSARHLDRGRRLWQFCRLFVSLKIVWGGSGEIKKQNLEEQYVGAFSHASRSFSNEGALRPVLLPRGRRASVAPHFHRNCRASRPFLKFNLVVSAGLPNLQLPRRTQNGRAPPNGFGRAVNPPIGGDMDAVEIRTIAKSHQADRSVTSSSATCGRVSGPRET